MRTEPRAPAPPAPAPPSARRPQPTVAEARFAAALAAAARDGAPTGGHAAGACAGAPAREAASPGAGAPGDGWAGEPARVAPQAGGTTRWGEERGGPPGDPGEAAAAEAPGPAPPPGAWVDARPPDLEPRAGGVEAAAAARDAVAALADRVLESLAVGGGRARLRLAGGALAGVTLDLRVDGDRVSAALHEGEAGLPPLRRLAGSLAQALAARGFAAELSIDPA